MSRKDTIEALFVGKTLGRVNNPSDTDKDRVRTGAISAMGNSLKELTEGAKVAARLQEQIDAGNAVIELDPDQIDGSMVSDRLTAEIDPSFDLLVASIEECGQQVPILVRPHPEQDRRYQVAYGRRRMRAATTLGIKVKAIVRQLSDNELVVAQGKENLDRRDLSYIEKALFARRLEDQGFDRAVIISALSTDKADLSRYIAVARVIPEPLLHAIGPAIKAGRARWLALADLLKHPRSEALLQVTIESPEFRVADSNSRFVQVFETLAKRSRKPPMKPAVWTNRAGQRAARIEHRGDRTTITIDETLVPLFGAYLATQLDDLYDRFSNDKGGNSSRKETK